MITVENVSKQYGSNSVLRGISVQLREGAIYGLVGANGCGKTTLMRCICGFSQPTSGYVVVNGCLIGGKSALRRNPELAKAGPGIISRVSDFAPSTGVIIETPGFLPHETGLQNLLLLAAMSGRADRLRARLAMIELGLDPDEKKPVWKYSLGQRQRLGFAQAFMEDPDVLILDEPFNAMDKASMEEVHDLLQRFKAQNKTVLLASHSAEDIARACDVIYEMEDGELHLVKQ